MSRRPGSAAYCDPACMAPGPQAVLEDFSNKTACVNRSRAAAHAAHCLSHATRRVSIHRVRSVHGAQVRRDRFQNPLRQAATQATSTTADIDMPARQQDTQPSPFDWRSQWYPVHFARDLPEGQPQRVYIFDEPVVLLKRPGEQGVVALRDRCPHRAAALSEGRMTPDGQLQCAYHGWSFDGASGICTNIPQVSEPSQGCLAPQASDCTGLNWLGDTYPAHL